MQRLRTIINSSDSDDSEDDFIVKRPRWIKERNDHFDGYDDEDFRIRFRLSKAAVYDLLIKIENNLEFISERNQSISPMNQLLATLRFYATNNSQLTIGDYSGLSTPTAQRIIHRVSAAIASLHREYIKFPSTQQEIRRNQNEFYQIARFPRVIGAMDCTHVRISSPGGDQAELFRNRKGYFSINVQTICNANLEIIDIVARWPGSAHDSAIFNNCYRKAKFEAGEYGAAILLVDGGYASTSYSMPPLENPRTPAQQLYNESQIRTRNPVERSYGVWKRRFPVLSLGLNMLRQRGEEVPPDDLGLELPAPWEVILQNGQIRSELEQSSIPQQNRARDCCPRLRPRRLLFSVSYRTLHFSGIKSSLYVIPDYNQYLCQIS
ncbi:hypothetical protein ABMA27_003499 [Loxostege sticticalis]|uniref:DDE Tnp4 domain-containing protein n=1 Tax=Loxostege sticticalis TaxID=481309 RepID=A0ABR3HT93_LOXSC